MSKFATVLYEIPAPGVVRIVQNRPQQRNAQDLQLTHDLNDACDAAAQDDALKVIILAGADPIFPLVTICGRAPRPSPTSSRSVRGAVSSRRAPKG